MTIISFSSQDFIHMIQFSIHFTTSQLQIIISIIVFHDWKILQSWKFAEYVNVTLSHICIVFDQFEHHNIMIEKHIAIMVIIFLNMIFLIN